MNSNFSKIENLKRTINNDAKHIFLISNPIFEVISYLWIKTLAIRKEQITLINLRQGSSNLIKLNHEYFKRRFFDRLLNKLGMDSYSKKVLKWVTKNNKNFYIYCSRLHPEALHLLRHKNCLGHFYIDEGQISHSPRKIFDKDYKPDDTSSFSKFAFDREFHFRNDALSFIGIDNEVFPLADKNKKIILSNLNLVKKIYKPYLIGKKTIALIPAPRRIEKISFYKFIENFITLIPDYSCIKFHPGYQYNDPKLKELQNKINLKFNKNFLVCSNKTILEIEMLFEKKIIYGSKCSLQTYSKLFGSTYELISTY